MAMKDFLFKLYKINNPKIRSFILSLIIKIEGGEIRSVTLRRIMRQYHDIEIGKYSHGGCFNSCNIDRFTSFGNYSSIARTVRTMNRNHPMDHKSTHAIFFNPELEYCKEANLTYQPLAIMHDVWMGHNSIVLPSVSVIETGSVIAAGAVVNKNIPPYSIVVGNPARVVRYRFDKKIIDELLQSKWWEMDMDEILPEFNQFRQPYSSATEPAGD